jgi:hypothetical protein
MGEYMKNYCARWAVVAILFCFMLPAAEPTSADIPKLIQQLGAEDFPVRETADIGLRKLGVLALPSLREALASAKDVEVQKRLSELIMIFPPDRKPHPRNEVANASDPKELFRQLYDEWLTENRRIHGLGGDYRRLKYIGPVHGNQSTIQQELLWLLRSRKAELVLEACLELEKEHGKEIYRAPGDGGGYVDLAPKNFIGAAAWVPRFVPKTRALPEILRREQPPNAEEWKQLCADMKEYIAPRELVSMVFNDAKAWDVIATISVQTAKRFFFEPVELNRRLENETITMRLENVPWDEALTLVLKQLRPPLQFHMEGEEKARYGLISTVPK